MDMAPFAAAAQSALDAAGIVDLKSAVGGAVLFKVAEPYLIGALVRALPRALARLLALAKSNPAARQVLMDHRAEFESVFDAMDAEVHKALEAPAAAAPKAEPAPPAGPDK